MMASSKMTVLPDPVGAHTTRGLSVYITCHKLNVFSMFIDTVSGAEAQEKRRIETLLTNPTRT